MNKLYNTILGMKKELFYGLTALTLCGGCNNNKQSYEKHYNGEIVDVRQGFVTQASLCMLIRERDANGNLGRVYLLNPKNKYVNLVDPSKVKLTVNLEKPNEPCILEND